MTGKELTAEIVSRIKHLYDRNESLAIARAYLADRLGFKTGKPETIPQLPEFFLNDMNRLVSGEPLQYITGIQHFHGLEFKVSPAVLIPRPETEELTGWISESLPMNSGTTILDIGTGSGCIPVILKLKSPVSVVYATDISEEALEIARYNSKKLGAEVHFVKDSIFNSALVVPGGFDIIVSNPPYIPLSQKKELAPNVVRYEPHLALFAPDENPVIFYKAICDYAQKNLKPNGKIYFEVHPDTCSAIVNYLETTGFSNIEMRYDLSGKLRFIRSGRTSKID
jgi:release factor glutamine methyltransferase